MLQDVSLRGKCMMAPALAAVRMVVTGVVSDMERRDAEVLRHVAWHRLAVAIGVGLSMVAAASAWVLRPLAAADFRSILRMPGPAREGGDGAEFAPSPQDGHAGDTQRPCQ